MFCTNFGQNLSDNNWLVKKRMQESAVFLILVLANTKIMSKNVELQQTLQLWLLLEFEEVLVLAFKLLETSPSWIFGFHFSSLYVIIRILKTPWIRLLDNWVVHLVSPNHQNAPYNNTPWSHVIYNPFQAINPPPWWNQLMIANSSLGGHLNTISSESVTQWFSNNFQKKNQTKLHRIIQLMQIYFSWYIDQEVHCTTPWSYIFHSLPFSNKPLAWHPSFNTP